MYPSCSLRTPGLGEASCEGLEDYKTAEQDDEKGMKLTEEIRSGLLPAERKSFFEVKMEGFLLILNLPRGSLVSG